METCRTCAKCDFGGGDTKWLDLFHPISFECEMHSIRAELDNWNLKIRVNDGLPQKICSDCFTKLCTLYKFRKDCMNAQILLKNLFENIDSRSCCSDVDDEDELKTSEANEDDIERAQMIATSNEDIIEYCIEDPNNEMTTDGCILPIESFTEDVESLEVVSAHNNNKNNNNMETNETAVFNNISSSFSKDKPHPVNDILFITLKHLPILPQVNTTTTATLELEENIKDEEIDHEAKKIVKNIDGSRTNENTDEVCEEIDYRYEMLETNKEMVKLKNLEEEQSQDYQVQDQEEDKDLNLAYECKYCFKTKNAAVEYFTQESLFEHIELTHDLVNPFDCPQCNEKFQDAPSRTVHIKSQHVKKQYTCNVCGKKYADRSNLGNHIEKYHSKADYHCNICNKKFPSKKSIKYHARWHIPERQMKCPHCDRLFISERQLKLHEATHTGIRDSEYCTYCGQSFFHIKTLRWHIYRMHGGEKPYKCSLCKAAFTSYKEKRLHMLENHAENLTFTEKSHCMVCHKKCLNEKDLKEHMENTHEENPVLIVNKKRILQTKKEKQFSGIFQCEICPQRFNLKSALDRHSAVHNVEGRPHACSECKKRFKRVQDLRWHMKTHSDEKPNVCDICGKGFALKYVLTQHRKSHEAIEKCFQCSICGRTYLFEKSLRLHERVHTGKTYYKCDICNEKFVTHIKFLCHMRKVHPSANSKTQESLDEIIDDVISE